MKEIPLTQGKVAIVDDEDYNWLSQWRWCAHKGRRDFYAVRNSYCSSGKRIILPMHRQILGLGFGDSREGDHKNHNTLDNRRKNIRIAQRFENARNTIPQKQCTSIFKGVHWNKNAGKWQSQISVANRLIHLGYYVFEELAALAYDLAAMKYHKEFASFNF